MLRQNDCLRAAVAMVIDLHPSRLRYIDSRDNGEFWNEWVQLLAEKGYRMFSHPGAECPPTDGPWIASVPSVRVPQGRHAVVMVGDKLFHDPCNIAPRSRKPRKFWEGFVLKPISEC